MTKSQILNTLEARLSTLTKVRINNAYTLEALDMPSIYIKDTADDISSGLDYWLHTLNISIEIFSLSNTELESLLAATLKELKSINLAQTIKSIHKENIEIAAHIFFATKVDIEYGYYTKPFEV